MIDLRQGDCVKRMREMEDNTVDFILTDPPYELTSSKNSKKGFMGKAWDGTGIAFSVDMWREAFRVLKPGGYLMAFGGSRTYHRMAIAIEDAGFTIKDCPVWINGSGFPKALDINKNISKSIDKITNNLYNSLKYIGDDELCQIKNLKNVSIVELPSLKTKNLIGLNTWDKHTVVRNVKILPKESVDYQNLKNVNIVGKPYQKKVIETGINIGKKDFVAKSVMQKHKTKNNLSSANVVEKNLKEANRISEVECIVVESVEVSQTQLKSPANIVVKLYENQNIKLNIVVSIAAKNVLEWLSEKITDKIKEEEAQKTLNGKKKFLSEETISVLCAEVVEDLKHTILKELKNILNYDTTYQMECVYATTVIITKSIKELLISSMVDILERKNKQYAGYKTQLKPAVEFITLAIKPLSEKNFAENVMKWGTGGLNIDGCRVELNGEKQPTGSGDRTKGIFGSAREKQPYKNITPVEGRYPANLIISENIAPVLDSQSGVFKSRASRFFKNIEEDKDYIPFIYHSKSSKKDRNMNINGEQIVGEAKMTSSNPRNSILENKNTQPTVNNHATVKPTGLMKYLLKMGLPPRDSVVLDMFGGSGSTGVALEQLNQETGFNHTCILIEMLDEHCEIIKKRCCL